jgi:hypothetical protein
MSDQKASGSFTSSALDVGTKSTLRRATPEEIRAGRWKAMREVGKKGYVQLQTNMGNINLEIHCDWCVASSCGRCGVDIFVGILPAKRVYI